MNDDKHERLVKTIADHYRRRGYVAVRPDDIPTWLENTLVSMEEESQRRLERAERAEARLAKITENHGGNRDSQGSASTHQRTQSHCAGETGPRVQATPCGSTSPSRPLQVDRPSALSEPVPNGDVKPDEVAPADVLKQAYAESTGGLSTRDLAELLDCLCTLSAWNTDADAWFALTIRRAIAVVDELAASRAQIAYLTGQRDRALTWIAVASSMGGLTGEALLVVRGVLMGLDVATAQARAAEGVKDLPRKMTEADRSRTHELFPDQARERD